MCAHLIFSGGQGRALAQNTIKLRYITIWYSAGVLILCETTGVLFLCETTANSKIQFSTMVGLISKFRLKLIPHADLHSLISVGSGQPIHQSSN